MTPPQATPTPPRTNADIICVCIDKLSSCCGLNPTAYQLEGKEKARTLERELAEAKKTIAAYETDIATSNKQRDAYKAAAERSAVACERHGGLKGGRFCSECREALAEFDKPELTAFVTPAQRIWLERAVDFSLANDEVEDWSFLNAFVPEPGNTQIEQGESEEAT